MSYKLVMWATFVNTKGELSRGKLVRFRFAIFITLFRLVNAQP